MINPDELSNAYTTLHQIDSALGMIAISPEQVIKKAIADYFNGDTNRALEVFTTAAIASNELRKIGKTKL